MEVNQKLLEDALAFCLFNWGATDTLETHWFAEAIEYANPEDFKLKDSHVLLDKLKFDLWKLRVEYYVNKKILMYNPKSKGRDIWMLQSNFMREETKLQDHIYSEETGGHITFTNKGQFSTSNKSLIEALNNSPLNNSNIKV